MIVSKALVEIINPGGMGRPDLAMLASVAPLVPEITVFCADAFFNVNTTLGMVFLF